MKNARKQIPRYGPLNKFPISRAKMLDGTSVVVCYGPGQGPFSSSITDAPPSTDPADGAICFDWSPAGYALRMPQVVWLSLYLDVATYPQGGTPPLNLSPYVAQYLSLLDTCLAVKSAIEALRPGKTWVTVMSYDFSYENPDDPGGDLIILPNPHDTGFFMFAGQNSWTSVVPRKFDGISAFLPTNEFLGTNFLHIAMGGIYETGVSGSLPLSGPIYDLNIAFYGPTTFYDMAYPQFASHHVMIYGPQGDLIRGDSLVDTDNNMRVFLQQIAGILEPYGFTYEGEFGAVSQESLIQAIADNFGFDPDTGVDNPL